jgi:uncharacterized protein (DUF58 family)
MFRRALARLSTSLAARCPAVLRRLRPRRTLRPTREGWWCLAVTVGLGVTAMNTGNNLLYLLESMVLALVVISGVLSEQSVRGVHLTTLPPEEIFAGSPVTIGARLRNTKRRRPSYSVSLERPDGRERLGYLPRLGAGDERIITWDETLPERGRHRLRGVRIATRFPFGLFVKAARPTGADDVVVYPRRVPAPAALLRQAGDGGVAPARRRGRGHDLHDLRSYQAGDDPRMIHWRVSARTGVLTVRELEAETAQDACIVLRGDGRHDPARREQALAEAAAVAVILLSRGARVGLVGGGLDVRPGQGVAHRRRILTGLALYEPGPPAPAHVPAGVRTVAIELG